MGLFRSIEDGGVGWLGRSSLEVGSLKGPRCLLTDSGAANATALLHVLLSNTRYLYSNETK